MKTKILIPVFAASLSVCIIPDLKGGNGFAGFTLPAASAEPAATTTSTEDVASATDFGGAADLAGSTGDVGAAFVIRGDAASPAPVAAIARIDRKMPGNGYNKGYNCYNGHDYYTNAVSGCTNNSINPRR